MYLYLQGYKLLINQYGIYILNIIHPLITLVLPISHTSFSEFTHSVKYEETQ
jgi:hypothetical protein